MFLSLHSDLVPLSSAILYKVWENSDSMNFLKIFHALLSEMKLSQITEKYSGLYLLPQPKLSLIPYYALSKPSKLEFRLPKLELSPLASPKLLTQSKKMKETKVYSKDSFLFGADKFLTPLLSSLLSNILSRSSTLTFLLDPRMSTAKPLNCLSLLPLDILPESSVPLYLTPLTLWFLS